MPKEIMESQRKTKNLKYLRISNRAEIIRCLSMQGPTCRVDLARQLGLTKMAISSIIAEMLEEGLVCEQSVHSCIYQADNPTQKISVGAGRRATKLAVNADRISALGLYLSRDAIEGVWCNITGRIIKTWNTRLDETTNTDNYLEQMAGMIREMLVESANHHVVGMGVSCIGPLDIISGKLLSPSNFHGIHDIMLTEFITKKCSQMRRRLPVILDNDVNAAVQAEQLFGAGKNYRHVVYLGITNGIGAGIISYGRILQGSSGFGGELGHMSVDLDGPDCFCGNHGCLELYASIPVLLQKSGAASVQKMVLQAIEDPSSAASWLPRLMQALTTALVNIANIFDPEIILLGHQSMYLAPLLLPELESLVNMHIIQREVRHIPIRIADFGEQTPLIGAASLIFQAVFRGEIPIS
jgi:predicted NBD/HSP70 family sugar kinase